MRSFHAVFLSSLLLALSGCVTYPYDDPLNVNVVSIQPLPSQDMEVRFAVKIRVQNPNGTNINYNGVALDLDINGQPFASGVSNESGSVGRYAETVLSVPVSVSAFSALRQTYGYTQMQNLHNMPYVLRGKLGSGLFATRRFVDSGQVSLPGPMTGSR